MQKKWLNAAFIALLIFLAFYFYRKYRVAPDLAVKSLPLSSLDGQPARLTDYTGKKTVLCFSASWCGNCIQELKELREIAPLLPEDVQVLVISDEAIPKIEALKDRGYPFTFLKLNTSFAELGIHAIPTSYLLNGKMEVKKETVGYLNWKDETTRQHLLRLLES